MPPRKFVQGDERSAADDLTARAHDSSPSSNHKKNSLNPIEAALSVPAKSSMPASGVNDVAGCGLDSSHPSNVEGNLSNERSYSPNLFNLVDRGRNGRVAGRSLITWGRPRMVEKLLLHMHYELARHGNAIPFDCIAHRLRPGSSGGAIQQFLGRTRERLVAEGHLVPPLPTFFDHEIRGFVRRDPQSDDLTSTRSVRFDEPYEDSLSNLPDAEGFRPKQGKKRHGAQARGEVEDADGASEGGSESRSGQATKRPRRELSAKQHESGWRHPPSPRMAPATGYGQQAAYESPSSFNRAGQPSRLAHDNFQAGYGAPAQPSYAAPGDAPPHPHPPNSHLSHTQESYGEPNHSHHHSPRLGYGAPFDGYANPIHGAPYHGTPYHGAPYHSAPYHGYETAPAHHPHYHYPPHPGPSPWNPEHQQPAYYDPGSQRGPHPSYEYGPHAHRAGYAQYGAPIPPNMAEGHGTRTGPPSSQRGWSVESRVLPSVEMPGRGRDRAGGLSRGSSRARSDVREQDADKGLLVSKGL